MRPSRQTIITVAITLGVALLGTLLGLRFGQALIAGAILGVAISIILQRQQSRLLVSPKDEAEDFQASYQAAASSLLEMRTQASSIDNPEIRELALRITDQLSETLKQIDSPERIAAAPVLVDQLIDPAQASLTDYVWLAGRGVQPADDLKVKIEQYDLPAFEHAARSVAAITERPGPLDMNALQRAVVVHLSSETENALSASDPAAWGNRQRLVDQAERNP
jgi:hypothetical protein